MSPQGASLEKQNDNPRKAAPQPEWHHCDDGTIARLLDQHGPFVSRHRLMRIAMRAGLRSLDRDLDVEALRQLLVEDRADAALE
jgi:hypothetical protein